MVSKRSYGAKRTVILSICLLLMMVSCTPNKGQESVEPNFSKTVSTLAPVTTTKEQQATPKITKEIVSLSNTPVVSGAKTPKSGPISPQKEGTIPSCGNFTTPSPISLLKEMDGRIYYAKADLDHWFVLSGTPARSSPIKLPVEKADFFTISEDEEWLLAYSRAPEPTGKGDQYPYFLVSKNGEVDKRSLDLSEMTAVAQQNLATASFQYWKIEWLTNGIIKVRGAYGESSQQVIPVFVYQYYDVEQNAWLNEPFLSLPDRKPYQWVDLSPDLTRVLYLTEEFDFVLWDNQTHQKLWAEFLGTSQLPPYTVWSPDHQKVVFWTDGFPFNVQLLERDGSGYQQIQNPVYEDVGKEFQPYRGFFAWSPDSRYIALSGVIVNRQTKLRTAILYVYDTKEAQFTYRCPMGDANERTSSSNIGWSPDGRFIVTMFLQSNSVPFRIYDFEDGSVYQIELPGFAAIEWVKRFSLKH